MKFYKYLLDLYTTEFLETNGKISLLNLYSSTCRPFHTFQYILTQICLTYILVIICIIYLYMYFYSDIFFLRSLHCCLHDLTYKKILSAFYLHRFIISFFLNRLYDMSNISYVKRTTTSTTTNALTRFINSFHSVKELENINIDDLQHHSDIANTLLTEINDSQSAFDVEDSDFEDNYSNHYTERDISKRDHFAITSAVQNLFLKAKPSLIRIYPSYNLNKHRVSKQPVQKNSKSFTTTFNKILFYVKIIPICTLVLNLLK